MFILRQGAADNLTAGTTSCAAVKHAAGLFRRRRQRQQGYAERATEHNEPKRVDECHHCAYDRVWQQRAVVALVQPDGKTILMPGHRTRDEQALDEEVNSLWLRAPQE
jgi:hypothetical protein